VIYAPQKSDFFPGIPGQFPGIPFPGKMPFSRDFLSQEFPGSNPTGILGVE